MQTIIDINTALQKAMKEGKFIHAKRNGKLSNIKPLAGYTIVLEDGEFGTVLRTPNSIGDFMVELSSGARVRRNIVNGDILGYIT